MNPVIMSERTTVLTVVEKYKRAALVALRSKLSYVIKRSFVQEILFEFQFPKSGFCTVRRRLGRRMLFGMRMQRITRY